MQSRYEPGKILSNARWERTSPEGRRRIRKGFPSEARSDEKKKRLYYMLVALLFVRSYYLQRFSRALHNILPGL